MGNSLPMKVQKIVVVDLEKQGCGIKLTKNGWLIHFPDGTSYALHTSASDARAYMNFRSAVRRAGLTWPLK